MIQHIIIYLLKDKDKNEHVNRACNTQIITVQKIGDEEVCKNNDKSLLLIRCTKYCQY